jgi:hypothetical protein
MIGLMNYLGEVIMFHAHSAGLALSTTAIVVEMLKYLPRSKQTKVLEGAIKELENGPNRNP